MEMPVAFFDTPLFSLRISAAPSLQPLACDADVALFSRVYAMKLMLQMYTVYALLLLLLQANRAVYN